VCEREREKEIEGEHKHGQSGIDICRQRETGEIDRDGDRVELLQRCSSSSSSFNLLDACARICICYLCAMQFVDVCVRWVSL